MSALAGRRRAGVLIPLFSSPSTNSWGIGDIGDLAPLTAWIGAAGQRLVQLLPLNEMAPGQQSPYSAISAMAFDPIFIDVASVDEWRAMGGEQWLGGADRKDLDEVRQAPRVRHAMVRRLKETALSAAFDRFVEAEWRPNTERAGSLKTFLAAQAWWMDDYALFRAVHAREADRPWTAWPEPLRRREPEAMEQARRDLSREVLYYQYLQWLADTQWQAARRAARGNGVQLFGDLPFMVDGDSADVWARQACFRLDVSVGAPPDAFSATGQDWGMPSYDWTAMAADDFHWLRDRARRSAELYDGYRVDHLVGFYRTFGRPRDGGKPFFTPAVEAEQAALGERVLRIFKEPGAEIIAEDLGTVPGFVRASLAALRVPGFCVLRWDRDWDGPGQPFRDPADYPSISVATSGTHDTETLVVWWTEAPDAERRAVSVLPTIQRITDGAGLLDRPYDPAVKDALLEALFASASDLLVLPVQDVFGWADRINEPATVSDENWTFRLPWPCDRLDDIPEARACQAQLRTWAERYSRVT